MDSPQLLPKYNRLKPDIAPRNSYFVWQFGIDTYTQRSADAIKTHDIAQIS
jgi:hypothetical protein